MAVPSGGRGLGQARAGDRGLVGERAAEVAVQRREIRDRKLPSALGRVTRSALTRISIGSAWTSVGVASS